ncbi:site-specific integrase [Rufibacter soli]
MTINFYLDKPTAARETAIYLFLRSGGKTLKFNTGHSVHPKYWDCKNKQVKKNYTGSPEFNLYLSTLKAEVQKEIMVIASSGSSSLEEIRDIIASLVAGRGFKEDKVDFLEAYGLFLETYKATRNKTTVAKYQTILSHLQGFAAHKRIRLSFALIDLKFSEGWTTYLIKEARLTNNTIAKKISLFKTFMHWATERGYNNNLAYNKFKYALNKVDIITLTNEELMAIYSLDLDKKPALERVRDVFCFGCFTGQRFSDVSGLHPDHIKGKVWHLHTQKTKDILAIPLNDFAWEILEKYINRGQKLPSISNQKTNEHLKELGKLAGIIDPITVTRYRGVEKIQKLHPKYMFIGTHTARRTFVTLSLEKGMRPETAMKITGHSDYRTFKKYIDLTSKVTENEMNRIWSK